MEAITARRVCLIGAECTGKTRLADDLARHFATVCVPEYAREYALRVARPLTYMDVTPIAEGQIALFELPTSDLRPPTSLAILDTDLISTVVYSRHHYGLCPGWIEREARKRRADLYLLLDIDVPWVADPARDSGQRRDQLHDEFREALEEFEARYELVSGEWKERLRHAIHAIEATLQS